MTRRISYHGNLLGLSDDDSSSGTSGWAVGDGSWAFGLCSDLCSVYSQGCGRTSGVGQVTAVVEMLWVVDVGGGNGRDESHRYGGGELHLEYVDRPKYEYVRQMLLL